MAVELAVAGGYSGPITNGWIFKLEAAGAEDETGFGRDSQSISKRSFSMLDEAKRSAARLLSRPWQKRRVKWDAEEWNMLECHSMGYDTHSLMISCGTVTMDKAASADRMVLLIWNKNTMAVSSYGELSQ